MHRKCLTAEADIGMRNYLCPADGTGGHLKTLPEDFVVREISDPPREKAGGDYAIATVTSRNWETNRLVRIMARSIGMSRERIGFAGVEVSGVYRGSRAIQIGDLVGNEFEITVRDCTMDPSLIPETVAEDISVIRANGGFPNYFGVQRFGVVRPVTHLVGERLVRGDIEGAVRTYVCFTTPEEDEALRETRTSLEGTDDWGAAAKVMPEQMSYEKTMAQMLAGGGSWTDAIDALPTNLQMMFVHAYQSYIFNEILSLRMDRGLPLNMPVVGDVVIPLDSNRNPQHENPVMTTAKNLRKWTPDYTPAATGGKYDHRFICIGGEEERRWIEKSLEGATFK